MPPFLWWLHGRAEIRRALLVAGNPCEGARLVPTVANGSPAFAQYRPSDTGDYEPFALVTLELSGDVITALTNYLDVERLFPLFGLPVKLPADR
jgi:RNA polymerase sigma-70 factor (ECF subfamily)